MSRRDIIIIAVLLNTAVLSFLFLTATRPEDEQTYRPTIENIISLDTPPVNPPDRLHPEAVTINTVPRDEVDSALRPYLSTKEMATTPRVVQEPGVPHIIQIEEHDAVVIQPTQAPEPVSLIDNRSQELEVVVKRGDVLEKIARAHNTSVKELKKLNNLTTDRISVGQVLRIPATTTRDTSIQTTVAAKPVAQSLVKEPVKPAVVKETASGREFYTVKPGDNPWKIARQNKIQLDELLKMNGLTEESARNLKVGDQLRVR